MKAILSLLMLSLTSLVVAQEISQTVRGTLVDTDAKTPIYGAKVVVVGSNPVIGSVSDFDGIFKLENVPVGRIDLRITASGYEDITLPAILVESGKEKVLNLEMTEKIKVLKTVNVKAKNKSEAINSMATVSAKTFTVEETNRYSGSLNDPARMVSAFAGVTGDAEGNNDIVVRGNSPRGILWRLEGIDIPNPNHFAGENSTGGPVNTLNGSMLANSDFFSGAFAAEYGNVSSGVFDVRFREGNNEQREYTFSAGALGLDGTIEGPFKKGYRGSYLVNYRYSSVALMDKLGILDFDGIPTYQDASFKIMLPTKKAGKFSLVGLGGISKIIQTDKDDDTGEVFGIYDFGARLGMVGVKHMIVVNPKVYIKSYVAATTAQNSEDDQYQNQNKELVPAYRDFFRDSKFKVQSIVNYKHNQKNIFQVGATYTLADYKTYVEEVFVDGGPFVRYSNFSGKASFVQSFLSWKYRATNDLTFVTGVHHLHFLLNNQSSIEPRFGMKWKPSLRQSVSLGFGMHSRLESVSTYLYNELQSNGTFYYPNRNLGLSKSAHFVAGYGFQLSEHLHLKSEVYYQHLYNIPIRTDSIGWYSLINASEGIPGVPLANQGTGRNYGIEVTAERFFHNNFYFLVTGSLYQSKYTAHDGIERNSRFNANYAGNILAGKEFKFGKKKNKTLGLNTKISVIGGNRYTPIDLAASQLTGETVRDNSQPFGAKGDDIFFLNFGVTYRVDTKKASHSIKIDVQNITNHKSKITAFYNSRTNSVDYYRQLAILPNIIYTIKF